MIGGRFNAYLNEAHVVKEPYLTQEGPDYKKGSMNGTGLRGDHFVKCVPLWQLTLYFMIAGEGNDWYRPDFWADVNWAAIQDNRTGLSNGERYVNFMKRSIEASGYNLAPFFEQMGLLRVISTIMPSGRSRSPRPMSMRLRLWERRNRCRRLPLFHISRLIVSMPLRTGGLLAVLLIRE